MTQPANRPATWWYLLPPALLVVFLCVGGTVARSQAISGERSARPVAGPGESVHFTIRAGTTFTVYQRAQKGDAGSDCTLAPDGDDAEGLSFGSGSHLSDAFQHRPERVTADGAVYEYAMQVSDLRRKGITVSCRGGPILVESGTEPAWSNIIIAAVAVAFTGAALAFIAVRRRQPD